jgi:23S rRNA (cytosine1962-C5)-methyltransferase
MEILSPDSWNAYELIDSGDFEKLERFGDYVLIRPEPQAIWSRKLTPDEWNKLAHARFDREQKDKFRFNDEVNGGWQKLKKMNDSWQLEYFYNDLKLKLRLALTNFGHVGIFPEQGTNWNFIHDELIRIGKNARVLNLFAYTGAASVVAKNAGADVIHCDASRPGINWANQNMQLNNLTDIRWVHEDAFKFVRREVKRGNTYNGIIMDPPPYGRGPEGEKWVLQEKLNELVSMCSELLEVKHSFFILNMYAVGLSAMVGKNIVRQNFNDVNPAFGEFYLKASKGIDLPMGTFVRFSR